MLRGISVLKPYVNFNFNELHNLSDMNKLKKSEGGLRRKNINPNYYVHCCIIGCHGNSLLHLVSCEGLFSRGGGIKYFEISIS